MAPKFTTHGKVSWFGGPSDTGVSPSEGLAFIYDYSARPDLFLPKQPPGTTGLARRLNNAVPYVACRWDYSVTPKSMLAGKEFKARVSAKGKSIDVWPADWGPNQNTGRVADVSPAVMEFLGIKTDDVVDVVYPIEEAISMPAIAISSGHSQKVRGAAGIIDEWTENVKVVDKVCEIILAGGGKCVKFHDMTSTSQSQNLNTTSSWHNRQTRDWDIQVHFNASQPTSNPVGTEVLYVSSTGSQIATKMVNAQAASGGFKNRGIKKRTDLHFLNATNKPAALTEICFVDSGRDCELYAENFDAICQAIALALVPELQLPGEPEEPPPVEPPPVGEQVVDVKIFAPPGVRIDVTVNSGEAEG